MKSADAHWTVLVAHPDTSRPPVCGIAAEVRLANATTLVCNYSLHGDAGPVRVSGAGSGRRADGLWQHTCFEVFISPQGAAGYYEFNFSPQLDWAAYQFTDYRDGMAPANLTQAPGLQLHRSSDQLELAADVHFDG